MVKYLSSPEAIKSHPGFFGYIKYLDLAILDRDQKLNFTNLGLAKSIISILLILLFSLSTFMLSLLLLVDTNSIILPLMIDVNYVVLS